MPDGSAPEIPKPSETRTLKDVSAQPILPESDLKAAFAPSAETLLPKSPSETVKGLGSKDKMEAEKAATQVDRSRLSKVLEGDWELPDPIPPKTVSEGPISPERIQTRGNRQIDLGDIAVRKEPPPMKGGSGDDEDWDLPDPIPAAPAGGPPPPPTNPPKAPSAPGGGESSDNNERLEALRRERDELYARDPDSLSITEKGRIGEIEVELRRPAPASDGAPESAHEPANNIPHGLEDEHHEEDHHEVDENSFDSVEHYLGEKRKERLKIIDEARARAIRAEEERVKNPSVRARAIEDEKARQQALLDRQVRIWEEWKAEAADNNRKFDEPHPVTVEKERQQKEYDKKTKEWEEAKKQAEKNKEKFDIEKPKLGFFDEREFEVPTSKFLDDKELDPYIRPEERAMLEAIKEETDKYAELNKEKLEYLASPEHLHHVTTRIMKWEGMRKMGMYKEIDWKDLDNAYDDQILISEARRLMGLKFTPKADVLTGLLNQRQKAAEVFEAKLVDEAKIDATGTQIEKLYKEHTFGLTPEEKYYEDLNVFFGEAKKAGILADIDKSLANIFTKEVVAGIHRGISATDIMNGTETTRGAEYGLTKARQSAQSIFKARLARDPGLARLVNKSEDGTEMRIDPRTGEITGIWDLYIDLARQRFWNAANNGKVEDGGKDYRPYLENEFRLDAPIVLQEERYWRQSEVGYLQIYAKTPQEYETAAETYITDAQNRTSDPSEVFQDVTNFLRMLTQSSGHQSDEFKVKLRESKEQEFQANGDKPDVAKEKAEKLDLDKLTAEFLKNITFRMQAQSGLKIADHSNELYHGAQYKQGMDFMAKDGEGPNRWLALMQIPGVAEALWKMDNDPRFEMLFALHGSRGQLSSDTVAQIGRNGGLHKQVQNILVEELLGTRITNPANRANVAKDTSEKKFAAMFDGLYEFGKVPVDGFQGDGYIKFFRQFGMLSDEQLKDKVPPALIEDYHLGRIQYLLQPVNAPGGGGGLGHHQLTSVDVHRLLKAEQRADKAAEIAMEIYGAMGEKSKRGGGVFKVWKVDPETGKEYFDFVPTHQGEKFAQFAETVAEMRYADDADFWKDGITKEIRNDVIGRRILSRNNGDLKNFVAQYRAAKVAQARDKALEEFAGKEVAINEDGSIRGDLTDKERHIRGKEPKNLTYEDRKVLEELNVVRRGGKGFEARLYEYTADGRKSSEPLRINRPLDCFDLESGEQKPASKGALIGYNSKGEAIHLNFDAYGKLDGKGLEYDKDDRLVLYSKAKDGERVNMHFTRFTIAQEKKLPILNKKGEKEVTTVIVESAAVDFALATTHMYSDWTSHTYWSYQEEDRNLLLSPKSFAEARQIKEGTLRPEEASVWGRQLLIVDPTLLRVMRFAQSKEEDHERKLTMAAVEHKYQSHWRISRELHRAFYPTQGTPVRYNGLYYGLQDFGGYRKMLESARAQIGEDAERFARRGKRLIPDLHIPYASAPEMWGVGSKGMMAVMRMFNAPEYRAVGTMALDKFSAQSEAANKMRSALVESRNSSGGYEEALLLKPTNNSDKLSAAVRGLIPIPPPEVTDRKKWIYSPFSWLKNKDNEPYAAVKSIEDYAYAVIESLGRYKTYMNLMPLMETGIRNSPGAFWFASDERDARDVFISPRFSDDLKQRIAMIPVIPEGESWNAAQLRAFKQETKEIEDLIEVALRPKLNVKDVDDAGSPNTGTSRHSSKIFHDTFGAYLVEQGPRGGGQNYKGERLAYSRIYDKWVVYNDEGIPEEEKGDIWDFVLTKLVPT